VAHHLDDVAKKLVLFLEKILPTLFDDWWTKAVVSVLSFAQKNRLDQRSISTLDGLDLACLLRILDQNWYQISNALNLSPESRHFVKEMVTVRNRWAHAQASGFNADDIYRDLDTIQRFAILIGIDDDKIQAIQKLKKSILTRAHVIKSDKSNLEQRNASVSAKNAEIDRHVITPTASDATPSISSNTNNLKKSDAKKLCVANGLNVSGDFTLASKNKAVDIFWANPKIELLLCDWWILLNDFKKRELYVFYVPAHSILANEMKVRGDKHNQIDLRIYYNDKSFEDSRSKIEFAKWLVKTISY
jgi:hypothetical protein